MNNENRIRTTEDWIDPSAYERVPCSHPCVHVPNERIAREEAISISSSSFLSVSRNVHLVVKTEKWTCDGSMGSDLERMRLQVQGGTCRFVPSCVFEDRKRSCRLFGCIGKEHCRSFMYERHSVDEVSMARSSDSNSTWTRRMSREKVRLSEFA